MGSYHWSNIYMSTSRNDVTGDRIASKPTSQAYRDGYDKIFGKKEAKQGDVEGSTQGKAKGKP